VQFQERPPDTELPEADEDQDDGDERWDPDSDVNMDPDDRPLSGRVKREFLEPEANERDDMEEDERPREVDPMITETTELKV
ncbi:hypothetical protein, partial [Klebsiella pneumoniae]|uniref:hypothetical protein n=1 Tax=Klebsiella pneumoniae TaxID=573 RepID=UPI0030141D0B